jgi:hypothetical protein
VLTLGILKSLYETGWGTAFLIWLFSGIAHVIVGAVILMLVLTGAFMMVP